jgi:RNA recognition motif-containing protein
MAFTVFLGNLPVWVTADDITAWLTAENLVADSIKVIRNPETQESKGFAFIEAPNQEEMESIIRRFDRAPLEDRLLRANPAQPPKGRAGFAPPPGAGAPAGRPPMGAPRADGGAPRAEGRVDGAQAAPRGDRPAGDRAKRPTGGKPTGAGGGKRSGRPNDGPPSAFAEELAKAL